MEPQLKPIRSRMPARGVGVWNIACGHESPSLIAQPG
jgi:hypothetical protein